MKVAKVILPIALDKAFDYLMPDSMSLAKGMRVLVDFGVKKRVGIVVGLSKKSSQPKLKSIIKALDHTPSLDKDQLEFAKALTKMYPYGLGEFLFMMLPSALKRSGQLILEEVPAEKIKERPQRLEKSFIEAKSFVERYSLWKDSVKEKLKEGSVLVCFPQLEYLKEALKVIEKDFPGKVKVIHSQKSQAQILKLWKESRHNTLLVGSRVALFYYPCDLALCVIEEENSPYYFQAEKPYHHLLDVAHLLCEIKGSDLILSADYPTLATYEKIKENKIKLKRKGQAIKNIRVVEIGEASRRKVISPLARELMRKNLEANKRMVVLWHRKGFGKVVSCNACGYIITCDRCSGFLKTTLKEEHKGICFYCGSKKDLPSICPQCKKGYLRTSGLGIEKMEVILKGIFPEAKICSWEERKPDSQIVVSGAKILSSLYGQDNFDVGFFLDVDNFLSRIDYEAAFDTFIYLEKLSHFFKDTFYVFSRNSNHYLFRNIQKKWEDFYQTEVALRKELYLPPFGALAKIILRAPNQKSLFKKCENLYNKLKGRKLEVYGPFEEYPFQLRGNFRYSLIIKSKKSTQLRKIMKEEVGRLRRAGIKIAAVIK
ncbi:MAG: hypothetical protein JSW17_01620 [Candidatus Omnitrophota bacterium]|nr:MAG: hypothetical protein JSW17_01620 [Candidatus Omnitrophota bacterium]